MLWGESCIGEASVSGKNRPWQDFMSRSISGLAAGELRTIMIYPESVVSVQEVGRHYDQLDGFYREIWGEHVHHGLWTSGGERPSEAVVRLVEVVAQGAGISAGQSVCDVGCGYGGTSRWLAETMSSRVVGFTVSAAQHAFAVGQNTNADNPEFHLCDWLENPLADGSMDAVVSIECFTHVTDKPGYFREIRRVLKPGGRAAITVWMHNEHPRALADTPLDRAHLPRRSTGGNR